MKCELCEKVALYRNANRGYCGDHREDACEDRKASSGRVQSYIDKRKINAESNLGYLSGTIGGGSKKPKWFGPRLPSIYEGQEKREPGRIKKLDRPNPRGPRDLSLWMVKGRGRKWDIPGYGALKGGGVRLPTGPRKPK